jgi:hypothetical protein
MLSFKELLVRAASSPNFHSEWVRVPNPHPNWSNASRHSNQSTITTMTTSLQPHLDSISSTSSSIAALAFNTIPTHFISSLLHQSGVDNLIRDPHPHERGLFTVRPPREKENIPLNGDSDSKVLRTRSEKPGITPLLLAKYSAGGNVEADVFLNSVNRLLEV